MDEIKFNELVKEAMVKFHMLRDEAAEYVAISNGLIDGDVSAEIGRASCRERV